MKKIAVIPSNYIPWKGHCDMIAAMPKTALDDDARYTGSDWRHRHLIKTTQWQLTFCSNMAQKPAVT
ncbi:WbqC family protein [Dyella flagellata]|uniref:Uncharacterized protein n=1 Tax=Dyella flagellata TaxID=1867833 RepID=A0ABQ5X903_9GAMM|nr:WbqC family protein [Dyella flagellata]GLQ88094.1 hypothetical protein GCM10007898_16630 [Dyella flagellata]